MNKNKLYQIICKSYEYVFSRVMNYNDFCFEPKDRQKTQINNFIDFLIKKVDINVVGEEWVFNFIVFSFKIRVEQKTRFEGKIPLNWIIGKKSFENFQKRNENWMYFNEVFQKQHGIRFFDIQNNIEVKTSDYLSSLRKQGCGSGSPLLMCFGNVAYTNKSIFCISCKDKSDCKELNN